MAVCGIDIGASTGKIVILDNEKILAHLVVPSRFDTGKTAENLYKKGLELAGVPSDSIQYIVATGYGRSMVPMAKKVITEITCHARGAYLLHDEVRTVIDIGGQDSKGIALDEGGRVIDFVMNDKCAAGTGKFLEVMAEALEVNLEDLGILSFKSTERVPISSTCTVFAESEVISYKNQGKKKEDIVAGLIGAIASRLAGMVNQISVKENIMLTGGVAFNEGVVKELEKKLGAPIIVPENPQIVGALGAALLASEILTKDSSP
jgi:predicted CoA-substrate-specific enzyme activase